jgi:hypothetical protein
MSTKSEHTRRTAPPRTLADAHEYLMAARPAVDASPATWLRYRELGARIYTEVADIDRFHHHEAMAWAWAERAKAEKLREDSPPGS